MSSVQVVVVMIALLSCSAQAAQAEVHDRVLTSRAFPVGTITIEPDLTYLGNEEFVLYGLAACEIHLWVDAPNKRVQRMYWVQFESYLATNSYTYDYSDLPGRLKLGSHVFFNGVRFFNLADDKRKWRPGSDYEHVLRMLEGRGYSLGPELMELALFRVDQAARRELMIIYIEDLATQGLRAAELTDTKDSASASGRIAEALRKRAVSGIAVKME